MKKYKRLLSFLIQSFKLIPTYPIILLSSSLLSSFLILFNAYAPKLIIDSITDKKSLQETLLIGLIIVIIDFVFALFNKIFKRLLDVANEKVCIKYSEQISKKVLSIPYQYIEDPYYLDLKERGVFAVQNQSALYRLLNSTADILKQIITIVGVVVIMSQVGIWLLLILIISIMLSGLLQLINVKTYVKFYKSLIPINRRYGYYVGISTNKNNGKDFRLYDTSNLLYEKIGKFTDDTVKEFNKVMSLQSITSGLTEIVLAAQNFGTYIYLSYRCFKDNIGIGNYSLYLSSSISFVSAVNSLVQDFLEIMRTANNLEPLFEFMDLKDEKDKGKIPFAGIIKEIEFKNVSFKYPRSNDLILDNVSFKINEGEKISIVGLNGAGKTTLVKLLCRLYHPTSGEILVNGINILDYDFNEFMKQISPVFQDFKLFNYSILENVSLLEEDEEKTENILKEVGIWEKIETLDKKMRTNIGKEFDEDATELSGGQMQKIAIARAIYKQSSLVILDEPTSALDPIAEAEIYENFNDMIKSKTAIYISHRMSSSVFSDRVLVIDGGKVRDFDTHENLMKKEESLYFKLFNSQAVNYEVK